MTTDPRVHAVRMGEFRIPMKFRSRMARDLLFDDEVTFLDGLRDRLITPNRPMEEYPSDTSLIGRGLAYVGPPGSGKTTRATAVLLEAYYQWNLPVYFLSYAEYVEWSKESWGKVRDPERAHQLEVVHERARTAPVLLMDDVGKETSRDGGRDRFGADMLDILLRARHRNARPTIITTNLPREEWTARYSDSMGSFIHEAFDWIPIVGRDHRRGKR